MGAVSEGTAVSSGRQYMGREVKFYRLGKIFRIKKRRSCPYNR